MKVMSRYTMIRIAWTHKALISVVDPSLAVHMGEVHSTKDFVSLDFSGVQGMDGVRLV